jgi:Phytanoyl-CoA dioxygenase (PhyH)
MGRPRPLLSLPVLPGAEAIASFQRDGFVYLPGLVPRDLAEQAHAASGDVVRSAERAFGICRDCKGVHHDFADPHCGLTRRPFVQLFNVWAESPAFRRLTLSNPILEAARALLGCAGVRLIMDQLLIKRPGDEETAAHVDFYHWPLEGRACSFWIPLAPVRPSMGTMRFYPGSHRRSHRPEDLASVGDGEVGDYTRRWIAAEGRAPAGFDVDFEPGDVTVHDGWTAHEAGPNLSDETRTVLAVHVMDATSRRTEAKNPLQEGHVALFQWQSIPPGAELHAPTCPVL